MFHISISGHGFAPDLNRRRVTLTLRCVHDENEMGHLIAAIGSCKALKQLRLDLDTTMSSGGCGFYALFFFFFLGGKMGEVLGAFASLKMAEN